MRDLTPLLETMRDLTPLLRPETIRNALAAPPPEPESASAAAVPCDGYPCPTCGNGRLRIIGHLAPHRRDGG